MIAVAQLILGIYALYYSANLLIDSGSLLAKKYNISKIVIGLTLIAFGTSLPEFIVSMFAVCNGKIDLVIGNVVGSNIANIGLVLGVSVLSYKVSCDFKSIKLDASFLVITSLFFAFILYSNNLNKVYAIILLFTLFIYMYLLRKSNKTNNNQHIVESLPSESMRKLFFFIITGAVGLSVGSHCLIEGATLLAKFFEISDFIIGATAIALGTSLPELATSLSAARKREFGLLLGNIFGSNIINIIFVFSISLLVNNKTPVNTVTNFDLIIFLFFTLGLILSLINNRIYRLHGIFLLSIYIYYIFRILSIHD